MSCLQFQCPTCRRPECQTSLPDRHLPCRVYLHTSFFLCSVWPLISAACSKPTPLRASGLRYLSQHFVQYIEKYYMRGVQCPLRLCFTTSHSEYIVVRKKSFGSRTQTLFSLHKYKYTNWTFQASISIPHQCSHQQIKNSSPPCIYSLFLHPALYLLRSTFT